MPFEKQYTGRYGSWGCIFSLTAGKFYKLKPQIDRQKLVTYDDNFIIFGNSEVRIQHKDEKFYSNFAIQNCNFEPLNDRVEQFVNNGKNGRYGSIVTYEVHQIIFHDERE